MMKGLPCIPLYVTVLIGMATSGYAQTPQATLQGTISFAPDATRTITLSRNGVTLASLEIPKGNLLRVFYDNTQPNPALTPEPNGVVFILGHQQPIELHGDVRVAAITRDQVGANLSVSQVMTQATLQLAGHDVDVVIVGRD